MEYTSTPVPACSLNPPLSSCGIPQANSTFSSARAISPWASESTLPCSAVMIFARSSALSCSSSRNANSTADRRDNEAWRQSGNAASADATAAFTSSTDARSTSPDTNPVAGLNTGADRPDVPATRLPFTQCSMRAAMGPR